VPVPTSVIDRSSLDRARLVLVAILALSILPLGVARGDAGVDHLVVSEVVTGGASASDELIELYNPTAAPLPLEGLEVVYVTASGATVSRRTAWPLGAPSVPAAGHVLIANASGIFASIADATYATGMAATGGSVAVRIQGASTAIDAVGWGTAASLWLEGSPTPAPPAGASIERLPGGALGSTVDTNDNHLDFVERVLPEPQNLGSAPTPDPTAPPSTPAPTSDPSAAPTLAPTPQPPDSTATPVATAVPTPAPPDGAVTVSAARAAADGTSVTVEAVALTASDFHDGGGFVADATGGIAVLVDGGSFARGERLRITGTVDDRFSQRTIRADGADIATVGPAEEPVPATAATGSIGEALEGGLVRVHGSLLGGASVLTTGVAFDLDDGSGSIRLVVPTLTGITVDGWAAETQLELVGVVGQRDSSGSGAAGYRVMPRDPFDIVGVGAPPVPTATATPSEPSATPEPTPTDSALPTGFMTVADARRAPKNARVRVRGVVTLPSGVIDPQTAAIQDGSGAILLRLGDEAGALGLGLRVDVAGTRSTKSGMESLRVTEPPTRIGTGPDPAAATLRTGSADEVHEAHLVVVSGAVVKQARRSSSGSVSFEIDDGSGPLKVAIGAGLRAGVEPYAAGTWVEVVGVLGQETTGAQPDRGYRVWPRRTADVRVVAAPTGAAGGSPAAGGSEPSGNGAPSAALDRIGAADLSELRIGATLVAGPWPELAIGGLLWDGHRLVAIAADSADLVEATLGERRPPVALALGGLVAAGTDQRLGIVRVALGRGAGDVVAGGPTAAPVAPADGREPAWVSVVGRVRPTDAGVLVSGRTQIGFEIACAGTPPIPNGMVGMTGIAIGNPARLVVPCHGVVPAPSVARSAAAAAAQHAFVASPAAHTDPLDGAAPALAAGLLAAAALGLVAGGGIASRVDREPAAAGSADVDSDSVATGEPDGPRLRLVPAPQERGG
jgi:uncharacterized protein YdeI (BOF family)